MCAAGRCGSYIQLLGLVYIVMAAELCNCGGRLIYLRERICVIAVSESNLDRSAKARCHDDSHMVRSRCQNY